MDFKTRTSGDLGHILTTDRQIYCLLRALTLYPTIKAINFFSVIIYTSLASWKKNLLPNFPSNLYSITEII